MKGLVEALQVAAPRPSAADHMSLFPSTSVHYPSEAALAALTAQWAAAGIWALATLGNATLYEVETEGLVQVRADLFHLTPGITDDQCAMTRTYNHAPSCVSKLHCL